MRRFVPAVFVLACAALPMHAQKADVTAALTAQQAAWNKGDMQTYTSFYKDAMDTEALLPMPVHGLQSIRNQYAVNFANAEAMGTLEETDVKVRPLGEGFVLATGFYHLVRGKKAGGEADGTFTDIFESTPRGWKIIYSATTTS
jgi:ketosteroid isomerase-like protein